MGSDENYRWSGWLLTHNLRRQWNQMLRLGLVDEVAPFSFVQVDFFPLCFAQFTGADKDSRGNLQGAFHNECASEAVDSP